MTMTQNMINTLAQLESGNHRRSDLARDWDRRTLNALESRGYIVIRRYDGFIRVTSTGYNLLMQMANA